MPRRICTALDELDVQVRDLELGMVDFPALMGPEAAFLCWRLDEPEVAFWHLADRAHSVFGSAISVRQDCVADFRKASVKHKSQAR